MRASSWRMREPRARRWTGTAKTGAASRATRFSVSRARGEGHRGGVGLAGLVCPADADLVTGAVVPQHRLDLRGGRDGVAGDRGDLVTRGQARPVGCRARHDTGDGDAAAVGGAVAVGGAAADAANVAAADVPAEAGEVAAEAGDLAVPPEAGEVATEAGEVATEAGEAAAVPAEAGDVAGEAAVAAGAGEVTAKAAGAGRRGLHAEERGGADVNGGRRRARLDLAGDRGRPRNRD